MAAPPDAESEAPPGRRGHTSRRLGWEGLGAAVVCFLAGLVASSILGVSWAVARGLDQDAATADLGFSLVSAAGLWVGFLALPLLWSRRRDGYERLLGLRARWTDLPLGLLVGLGATAFTVGVSSMILTAGDQKALEAKAETTINRAHGPVAVVLLVLALCVVTPIAEEVFFRGLLFRSLNRVAGFAVALLLGGLVFGLAHYDPAPVAAAVVAVQLGVLALFGMALCALTHFTGRLAASVVAHAAFNTVTVATILAHR